MVTSAPWLRLSSWGQPVAGQSDSSCPQNGGFAWAGTGERRVCLEGVAWAVVGRLYQGHGLIIMDSYSVFKVNLQAREKRWLGRGDMSLSLLAPVVLDQVFCPHSL